MTLQLDSQFEKEFLNGNKILKAKYGTFSSNKLPSPFKIPDLSKFVFIKGIEEPHFAKLNNSYASLYEGEFFPRRSYWKDGTVRKERQHKAYTSCVIVESEIVLGLTNKTVLQDSNYKYVDFREKDGKKVFYYEVPKSVCFLANMCTLVVSDNKRSKHLGGEKIALKNGHSVYLYILPLKNAKLSDGYKVLAVKSSNDFAKEINIIKSYWRQVGIMYKDPSLFYVESRTKGSYSLVSELQETDIEVPKYERTSLAKEVIENELY